MSAHSHFRFSLKGVDLFAYVKDPLSQSHAFFNIVRPRFSFEASARDTVFLRFSGDAEYYAGEALAVSQAKFLLDYEDASYFLPFQYLTVDSRHHLLFLRTYRLVLTVSKGPFTLSAGRQYIDWGRGYFFFPLNPFTPALNVSAEPEQIPGIDAVLVRADITDFISTEGVFGRAEKKYKGGINFGGYWKGVDFNFLYFYDGVHHAGGSSVAFNLFEGVLRADLIVPEKRFKLLLGYDRGLEEGFDLILEYFLNYTDGFTSSDKYPFNQILSSYSTS